MVNDYEGEEDDICGWGAADFDDEFTERKETVTKGSKRNLQRKLVHYNQKLQQSRGMEPLPLQGSNLDLENHNGAPVYRKIKRKQPKEIREPQNYHNYKPSPRTLSIQDENAAIAAFGRQRRMRVVAATMAANVPRKSGIASVVSASFDDESDDNPEEPEIFHRQECMPASAPQKQHVKLTLPRVAEPSTAPAGPIEAPKKIPPPVPLPLLTISPDSGGKETRLAGKGEPPTQALRHKRRQQQKTSLLPSRDVYENWESNFPPSLRRFNSSSKYQTDLSDPSNSDPPSCTNTAPVLVPHKHVHATLRAKEPLASIHQVSKKSNSTASSAICSGISSSPGGNQCNKDELREEQESGEDDDESWTLGYDDPDVAAKSMAGLIQALSTFAAGGKHSKGLKGGKSKKRRAKLPQQQQKAQLLQRQILLQTPQSRRPPPLEDNYDKSSQFHINRRQQEPDKATRRRKHRRVRNRHSNDETML
ncbi:hypothetical protein F441_08817 [Phytophthora nicotianae CJ01A1]|uniref:Uncharacterized protein n=1 Tax=Phytophthora nicotianae CJ01A1 TaxID=1317063 RepID=W2X1H2_PHYNI|nr:hypothetical protein F441_08817 [Phytophthora nicotianae CJ01A1]